MATSKIGRVYGWRPDKPDHRDLEARLAFGAVLSDAPEPPPHYDMRPLMPPVYDQGDLGSCTGNAICGAVQYGHIKQGADHPMFSRLFVYYGERLLEGTVDEDAGAEIRDGIKVVAKQGVCPEEIWPYDTTMFAHRPSSRAYRTARADIIKTYASVAQDLNAMRTCLSLGYPIIIGFSVYESFESDEVASTGVVNMPQPDEKQLGGHAVLVVGYDDATKRFIVRNSWGDAWGMSGYFTIPYEYLVNPDLAADFWQIDLVQ